MPSHFPARDVERPATVEHVDRRVAELLTGMAELRAEMHAGCNRMLVWLVATIVACSGVAVTMTVQLAY